MKKPSRYILGGVSCLWIASSLTAQVAPTPAPAASGDTIKLDEFVVTGVFNATSKEEATVAISTLDLGIINTQVAVSGADLLKNVPGVFVNSALGEIRNMVYSRGVSANTSDGANGYYYVSLQEDGLPITNVNYTNYGPDYFHRPDATLLRVEAVRGGSASITSANAPGGVFNYISKTGTAEYGGEVRGRFGLEGDYFPLYRADISVGGPAGDSGWVYNLGGFFRQSTGAKDPGYLMNNGGQFRANVFKDYGNGSIKVYGKYLNDHNGWYEFVAAKNPYDPVVAPGVSRYGTNLHRSSVWNYPTFNTDGKGGGTATTKTFDTEDLVHSRQAAVGVDWKHEFGDGWSIANNIKVSQSSADWSSSAGVAIRSLNNFQTYSTVGIQYNGTAGNFAPGASQSGRLPAGTYRFYDGSSGALVATVTSNGNPRSTTDDGLTVVSANLPGANLETNGVWSNNANVAERQIDELMDQFSVSKSFDKMTFTAGGFFGYADIYNWQSSGGRTLAPLTDNPTPLQITYTPATAGSAPAGTTDAALFPIAGYNGQTIRLTNEDGIMNMGNGWTLNEAVAKQIAGFFGHTWEITDRLNFDWGFRAESLKVKGSNQGSLPVVGSNYDASWGGADGNPLTAYDNRYNVPDATNYLNAAQNYTTARIPYNKSVDTFSWSAGTNLVITEGNSVYLRYAKAEKAPDQQFFNGYNSTFRLNNQVPIPQKVEQVELGYRYDKGRVSVTATPFYSELSNIYASSQATDTDGTTQYYSDPAYNSVTTYGIELESTIGLTEHFSVRSVVTWQKAEATKWLVFSAGQQNGRQDDRYIDLSGKDADNNPNWIANITPSYTTEKFNANLSWRYMGERAGNAANVITLPAYNTFDLGLGWHFSDRFSVNLNVNNLFDEEGVMSWAGWGTNPLDRQTFDTVPNGENQTLLIVTIPPRAYYLSATYKF